MNTKIVMIATLAVSVATFIATIVFGIAKRKSRLAVEIWDLDEAEDDFDDDEE